MHNECSAFNRRILVIDDTESIHEDFDKILLPPVESEDIQKFDRLDDILFDDEADSSPNDSDTQISFQVDHALQGEEGLNKVQRALETGAPYALAFVDMRMPPGWDGLQTIEKIWKVDSKIQIVICTAYSDYTWEEIIHRLGQSDHLLILKKPFDRAEVYQMAAALTEKWNVRLHSDSLRDQLEQKVEERTTELNQVNQRLQRLNGDLEEAVNEAECAARAKGRFLATMSHEIRTTLNGIMGASYMLSNSDLDETEKDFARIIQNSGESLMTIINDILDYSKYESGELELECLPFSLTELSEECVTLLNPLIDKFEIDFSLSTGGGLPKQLLGDAGRIRQIILNLLNNAFKFSKKKKVELLVEFIRAEEETAWVRISVCDNGIGMSQETQDRLFSAFMQADTSTTREYGGTGLGLAICQLLADAMQAQLSVKSEIGKGSTFSIEIPLLIEKGKSIPCEQNRETRAVEKRISEMPTASLEPTPSDAQSAPDPFSGKRALLVDDNPVNCKLAGHFLKKLNLITEVATNGAEAISLFEKNEYDFVLMDLQMPVLDGYEATKRIREIENASGHGDRLPIIALTANAFPEIRERCFETGMDDFLTKPLRMPDLKSALSNWLNPINN